jgi:hypothetical protein
MEFLCTCINLIKDERVVQELQHLLIQYEIGRIAPLLNKEIHQVSRKIRKNNELHLNAHIGDYDIDYVVFDLGSEVNVMTKHTWALMGKPKLIFSSIRLRMANQQAVSPFGRLEHVPVDIYGVRMFADFKVIEIVNDSFPYPTLLGIDWAFNNSTIVDLKKIRIRFEGDGLLTGEIDRLSTERVEPVRGCLNNPSRLEWTTLTGLTALLAVLRF